jgi:hypothetical protein
MSDQPKSWDEVNGTAHMTAPARLHEWVLSTLGHGEVMCRRCLITNREAAVLGRLNRCDAPHGGQRATHEEGK